MDQTSPFRASMEALGIGIILAIIFGIFGLGIYYGLEYLCYLYDCPPRRIL